MTESKCSELTQELAAMSDEFSELGERLLNAARQLHSPGAPPLDSLIEALSSSRRGFLDLRNRVRDHAGVLGVQIPPEESLETLQGISSLIDEATEVEAGRARGEETRRRALAILGRVAHLSHTSSSDFAPLLECVDKARQLHQRVTESDWSQLPDEAETLADGDHPYGHLLALVENRDLHDDQWAAFHESVGTSFGRALAAAAARAKLQVSGDAPTLPEDLLHGTPGERAGSRRNLGSATPSNA